VQTTGFRAGETDALTDLFGAPAPDRVVPTAGLLGDTGPVRR
jgi:hypothetical protein